MKCKKCPYKKLVQKCLIKCPYRSKKSKQNARIKPISKKQQKLLRRYAELRAKFLSVNTICAVYGTPATEIHHKMGRVGYADEWARLNGIPLLIDVRFFLAVSRKGHIKIENNPEWAKEKGYSLNRIR